jgi:hypothetical protein
MNLPLILRPAARVDALEARDWYNLQRQGLGSEFAIALEQMLDRIRDNPETYAAEPNGVRRAKLNRFP